MNFLIIPSKAANGSFYGARIMRGLISFWLSSALGRKKTLLIASVIGIVGAIRQGAAVHIAMFLVGRALAGIRYVPLMREDFFGGRMADSIQLQGIPVCFACLSE